MEQTSAETHGLPENAPPYAEDRPLGEPAMFVIFHTAPLSPNDREELATLINSGSSSSLNSKLAPTPDFSNRSMYDVYHHFLTLRDQDETVQPFYFIVADRLDFKKEGVLCVCLDWGQEGESDVGGARCEVDKADSWGARFCNGLADWEEMKEAEAYEFNANGRAGHISPEQKHADDMAKYGWDASTYPIQDRTVYGWYSLVERALPINRMLDPSWLDKNPEQCRFQMLGNYHTSNDPWADICREHPWQAAFRPKVHRSIVLVAEREDANEEGGIAIVKLKSDRPPKVLARVSAGAAIAEANALS